MLIVSTSYVSVNDVNNPSSWLERINYYTGVFEALAKAHMVISFERINYSGEILQNNVCYKFTRLNALSRRFPLQMHRKIQQLKPDVVLIHGLHFPLQLIQLRKRLGNRIKIFVQHHAEKPWSGLKKNIQARALRLADGYFFTSLETADDWINQGLIQQHSKIYEVMEASSVFSYSPGQKEAGLYLWVGRLNANKDPVAAINAFKNFSEKSPYARLCMIYQSFELEDQIKSILSEHPGLEKRIMLIGKQNHADMQNWYNRAEFIISTSHYEGSGVAVCEALSCGCIPILSDIPSFRKMTGRGRIGILFKAGNEIELVKALEKSLLINTEIEIEKTIRQFREELSFEAIASKMHQAFTSA